MVQKKYFLLFNFIFLLGISHAQYVSIPDDYFREFLASQYPSSFNAEGQMDTSSVEITLEDSLSLNLFSENFLIADLDGIQYFKSLRFLDCSYTNITQLPLLPDVLFYLNCNNCNALTDLPVLPERLRFLDCSSCQLVSLPVLPDSLKGLYFAYNSITDIPALPKGLRALDCSVNQIESLPAIPETLLFLDCSFNLLTSLPAIINTKLVRIVCNNNLLSDLPTIPKSLNSLYCAYNILTTLPVFPEGFTILNCSSNPSLSGYLSTAQLPSTLLDLSCEECEISELTPLPVSLRFLDCSFNQLTQLPALQDSLLELLCQYNLLTSLPAVPPGMYHLSCYHNDIYCLPKMPEYDDSTINFELDFDGDKITCVPNLIPHPVFIDYSEGTGFPHDLPLCNPTTNRNRCTPFPLITGTVFLDSNNNGEHDMDEPLKKNIKVQLSNGAYAFTNANGYFELAADNTGNYNISIAAPAHFSILPASYSYDFSTYDTVVSALFALQSISAVDSLLINVRPLDPAARPGSAFPYLVTYENTGTTILSTEILFQYDSTRLQYDSCSANAVNNSGNTLNLPVNNFAPGNQDNFIAYFTIKPTAATGDTLFASAFISTQERNYTDSNMAIIVTAFNNNDKQATKQLSPLQLSSGKPIDYSIYFQNSGASTAFNIVITDTISNLSDINTLEIVSSSHSCKTTVKDNVVYFEFLDIFLPDSNVNEVKSHGFVHFRIKPAASVVVNSFIENKASIYFDYSSPVITNTTLTAIKEPGGIFIFTGDGNWDNPLNWKNGIQPPATLTQNEMVILNPVTEGSCILNIPVNVFPGASIIVQSGKKFVLPGGLISQ